MASTARGYGAGVLIEESLADEVSADWPSRRVVWWDFEGQRILLREVTGPAADEDPKRAACLRSWDDAWDAFWSGNWAAAENGFAGLARDGDDSAARVFALRSSAARRAAAAK